MWNSSVLHFVPVMKEWLIVIESHNAERGEGAVEQLVWFESTLSIALGKLRKPLELIAILLCLTFVIEAGEASEYTVVAPNEIKREKVVLLAIVFEEFEHRKLFKHERGSCLTQVLSTI